MALFRKKPKAAGRSRTAASKEQAVSAYSYHNSRSELDEKEGRNKERANPKQPRLSKSFIANRFGAIILLIVCIVCLYSVLDLSTTPNIIFLGNKSDNLLYQIYGPAFKVSSTKQLQSSILNRNKITVDTNKITKDLESEFPEFTSISITLPLINHRPVIYLTPATPSAVLINPDGQYLLNQNGVAILYGSSNNGFNYLNLPMVTDQSGLHIALGKPALTSQNISFMQTVTTQLSFKHYQVSGMTLPQSSSELDVRLTGKPYYVKFNLEDNNARRQAGSFIASINYLTSQNVTPGQYVDVRTEGRVYYQ